MINAAVVGLGRWGRNLVDCTQGKTDKIRFTMGVVRTPDKARDYARSQGLTLVSDYAQALADPAIDAVVLATPHTQHGDQILAGLRAGTAEGWRMQIFGSRGWARVGSIPHLHTWSLTTCMVDGQPTVIDYPQTSTERAELEGFADAIAGGPPYACPPEDALHGVAVLEAIVKSARTGQQETIDN